MNVEESCACKDPDCCGTAEPEQDGDLAYYACDCCGYEFGYRKLGEDGAGDCAVGIPEHVRRKASLPPDNGVQGPLLQIGRRR